MLEFSRSTTGKMDFGTPLIIGLALLFSLVALPARAQVALPPGALDQLDSAIGQRVEATAILGTQNVASRAGLGWTLNNTAGAIYKIPWETELRAPVPLASSNEIWAPVFERPPGDTNFNLGTFLRWAPVFQGGIGYGQFADDFNNSVLEGNESDYYTVALSMGLGPRVYFGDSGFSILPTFSMLYAYTENDFKGNTPAGEAVVQNGQYVNWYVNTFSLAPGFEFRYKKTFGRWTPLFSSTFAYFNTRPITRSTDALSFRSQSEALANKVDLDYLTSLKPINFPMHIGGDFIRTDLYDGLRNALGTDFYYQTDGRITFDILGRIWKVKDVGITGGYFWCSAFRGYSIGLQGSMQF
jgi:Solitary outer membrane autotransporter beta-barrel domain